ncbi:MAG: hypothetical protein R2932_20810 [Caldilineaceae bacterium]
MQPGKVGMFTPFAEQDRCVVASSSLIVSTSEPRRWSVTIGVTSPDPGVS